MRKCEGARAHQDVHSIHVHVSVNVVSFTLQSCIFHAIKNVPMPYEVACNTVPLFSYFRSSSLWHCPHHHARDIFYISSACQYYNPSHKEVWVFHSSLIKSLQLCSRTFSQFSTNELSEQLMSYSNKCPLLFGRIHSYCGVSFHT